MGRLALVVTALLPFVAGLPAYGAEIVPAGDEFRVSRIGDTYKRSNDGEAVSPQVGRTSDDGFVVSWQAYSYKYGYYLSSYGYGVFARRFDERGNPKGKEFPIWFEPEVFSPDFRPALAVDGQDRFAVVWGDDDYDVGPRVLARRYNPAGNPMGGAFQVNVGTTPEVASQAGFGITTTPDDGFIVVWHDFATGDVTGRRFDGSGAPVAGEFTVVANADCSSCYPRVAADDAGRFTVVWQDDAGPDAGVLAQRFDATGAASGGPFQALAGATDEGPLAIAAAGAGPVMPVGYVADSATARVFDAAGSALGPQFQIGPSGDYAGVAADRDGSFIVGFMDDQDGHVFAQRYTPAGVADGAAFRVDQGLDEDAYVSNRSLSTVGVSPDSHGDFVVVWSNTSFSYPEDDQEGPYEAPGIWARLLSVCGNGRVGRTQTCDDGNATAGDGCSSRCDVETCSTCSGEPSACSAVPGCTTTCIDGAAIAPNAILTFQGATAPAGRQSYRFKGLVTDPPVDPLAYDPLALGLEVAITSGGTLVHEVRIPPGGPGTGCGPKDGWKRKGRSASWGYKNASGALPPGCATGSARGVRTVKLADKSATGGGITFDVKVSRTTIGMNPPVPPVIASVVLGQSPGDGLAGRCGRIIFTRAIGARFFP